MSPTEWQTLLAARDAIVAAGHGQKAAVSNRAAAEVGCSTATLYRKLAEAGLDTGRRRRADAGTSDMTSADLTLLSGVLQTTRRANGKQLWGAQRALDALQANGQVQHAVSPSRALELLRANDLHPEQLAHPKPTIRMASKHPNHVWQIDSSTSVLYKDKTGRMCSMEPDAFYKNKPENFESVAQNLVTRYLAVDHASAAFKGRYSMGGESAQSLIDFFIWAVCKQPESPMHGVPFMVYMDRGPGNTSHLWLNLARNLKVRVEHHMPGVANATGSVEKHGDIWECGFEGGFRFERREDLTLDYINRTGAEWAAAYCSSRIHSRHKETRFAAWLRITAEQLRTVPSEAVLRELVSSEPVSRRVGNDREISMSVKGFGSQRYSLAHLPEIAAAQKVLVQVNPYRAPAVDVRTVDRETGAEVWQTVAPIETGAFGFPLDAQVFGEGYRQAAYSPVDRARNQVLRQAYRPAGEPGAPAAMLPTLEQAQKARKAHAQAYAGMLDPMADVRATQVPTYMPRRGTALDTGPAREVAEVLLTVVDACKRLRGVLGDAYTPQVYAWVAARFEAGVPESQLASICTQFAAPAAAQNSAGPALYAVGGGTA